MSVSSAWISASTPASNESSGRIITQLRSRICAGTRSSSDGSSMQTGSSRLLTATAWASSSLQGSDRAEDSLSTNTNASERAIPSSVDVRQLSPGSIPAPSCGERSTQTSRSRAVSAARRRSTNCPSSRAYEMKKSGNPGPCCDPIDRSS